MPEHLIKSLNRKRVLTALGACLCIFSAANHFLTLGFLGRFSGHALLASLVVLFLLLFVFGPMQEEMKEYKRRRTNGSM